MITTEKIEKIIEEKFRTKTGKEDLPDEFKKWITEIKAAIAESDGCASIAAGICVNSPDMSAALLYILATGVAIGHVLGQEELVEQARASIQ